MRERERERMRERKKWNRTEQNRVFVRFPIEPNEVETCEWFWLLCYAITLLHRYATKCHFILCSFMIMMLRRMGSF